MIIGRDDLNAIKTIKELARESSATWITFAEQLVRDMTGNNVVSLPNEMAQEVAEYIPDTVGPICVLSHSTSVQSFWC